MIPTFHLVPRGLTMVLIGTVLSNMMAASSHHHALPVDHSLGSHLLQQARTLSESSSSSDDVDYSSVFVSSYAIRFLGCHQVKEYNEDSYEDGGSRIQTRHLTRFRLCPLSSCKSSNRVGCHSKYGDYVVDMATAMDVYLEAVRSSDNGDDNYYAGDVSASDHLQCSGYTDRYGNSWYIGPYCAQNGEGVYLGIFTDNTCATQVDGGTESFQQITGYELPYSSSSLIPTKLCVGCRNSFSSSNRYKNQGWYGYQLCENIYNAAGKCETYIDAEDTNDSACNFIEGLSELDENGFMPAARANRKSGIADIVICVLAVCAIFMALYTAFVMSKLKKTKVHLSSLT